MDPDHGSLNTADGLSAEDHQNGYHYYVCTQCGNKRSRFGYSYRWFNTLICTFCEGKDSANQHRNHIHQI